jgi:hypothetical protein
MYPSANINLYPFTIHHPPFTHPCSVGHSAAMQSSSTQHQLISIHHSLTLAVLVILLLCNQALRTTAALTIGGVDKTLSQGGMSQDTRLRSLESVNSSEEEDSSYYSYGNKPVNDDFFSPFSGEPSAEPTAACTLPDWAKCGGEGYVGCTTCQEVHQRPLISFFLSRSPCT